MKGRKIKLPLPIKEFQETPKGRCILKGWKIEKEEGSDEVWGWYAYDLDVTTVIIQGEETDGLALDFKDGEGNLIRVHGLEQLVKIIQDKVEEVQKEFPGLS